MNYVLDELNKSLKYHLRQLEENLRKITNHEESIQLLKTSNEKHREAITEIGKYVEALEQAE